MALLLDHYLYVNVGLRGPAAAARDADGHPRETFRDDGGLVTGMWAVEGVPRDGWWCAQMIDADAPRIDKDGKELPPEGRIICQMCDAHEIRFIHVMEHDDYEEAVRVGCYCAGYMENDAEAARTREADFKSEIERKKKFERKIEKLERGALASDWETYNEISFDDDGDAIVEAEGDHVLELAGYRMAVRPVEGGKWLAAVRHKASGHGGKSPHIYATEAEARNAAIKAMLTMARKAPKTSWGNRRKPKRGKHYLRSWSAASD